jgi:hypothetical protein
VGFSLGVLPQGIASFFLAGQMLDSWVSLFGHRDHLITAKVFDRADQQGCEGKYCKT